MYQSLICRSLQEGLELRQQVLGLADEIEACGRLLITTLAQQRRIFFCGNGGSAADCQHLAAELVGRFETDNQLPALALTTDSSILTSVANDFGFDQIYVRQLRALAQAGDCLIAISTSGQSSNVVRAVETAKAMGVSTLGLLGGRGGVLASLCSQTMLVPGERTCRIQEIHITIGHIWCEMIEHARRTGQLT